MQFALVQFRGFFSPAKVARCAAGALGVLALAFGGCDAGGPPQRACHPVQGQLFVRTQPAVGAIIQFQPQDGSRLDDWTNGFPRATVNADGTFDVSTYGDRDGAPAGEYVLLVEWPTASAAREGDEITHHSIDRLGRRKIDQEELELQIEVRNAPTTLKRIDLP